MSNSTGSYKARKEAFVSGLSGGSVAEINYVTAVAPVSRRLGSRDPVGAAARCRMQETRH